MPRATNLWALLLITTVSAASPVVAGPPRSSLPRYTEEREAASLYFVKKHLPELLPVLDQLRKTQPTHYQLEIREIFQVAEMLAELLDDPQRHELELKIWKTANRANILLARLDAQSESEQKKTKRQLEELSRELTHLDIQVLEVQVEHLEKELTSLKQELVRVREQANVETRARVERWLKAHRRPAK